MDTKAKPITVIKKDKDTYQIEVNEHQYNVIKDLVSNHHNIQFPDHTYVVPKAFRKEKAFI
jgi:hypothetical protein